MHEAYSAWATAAVCNRVALEVAFAAVVPALLLPIVEGLYKPVGQ